MEIKPIRMEINGVQMPTPKVAGIGTKYEKIWSKNTGRTASTRMIGTILSIKQTWSLAWNPLTQEQRDLLLQYCSNADLPFVELTLTEPDGSTRRMECYFGTPSFDEWDLYGGVWCCCNGKVDAIER